MIFVFCTFGTIGGIVKNRIVTALTVFLIFPVVAFGASSVEPGATQRHEDLILEVKTQFVKGVNAALFSILQETYQAEGQSIVIGDVEGLLDEKMMSAYFDEYKYTGPFRVSSIIAIPDDEWYFDELWWQAHEFAQGEVQGHFGMDYYFSNRVHDFVSNGSSRFTLRLPSVLKVTTGRTTRVFDVTSPTRLQFLTERIEANFVAERDRKLGRADDIVTGWVGGTGVIYFPFGETEGREAVDPIWGSDCEFEQTSQKIRLVDSTTKSEVGSRIFPHFLPDVREKPWDLQRDQWWTGRSCFRLRMKMDVVPD